MAQWAPEFDSQDVKILEETQLLSGSYLEVKRFKLQYSLFQGGTSKPILRELLVRPDAVAVLLIDPEAQQVLLVEQLRVGALADLDGPWLLELVAGVCEDGEEPSATAYREVKEETGCDIKSLTPICSYFTTPGIANEKIHIFWAKVRMPKSNYEIHGNSEESENIKVCIFSIDEALNLLSTGKIVSSPSVIGLQWLQIHRSEFC